MFVKYADVKTAARSGSGQSVKTGRLDSTLSVTGLCAILDLELLIAFFSPMVWLAMWEKDTADEGPK